MWKDNNNKIEEVFDSLNKIKKIPTVCPICKKEAAHIYMHVYDQRTRRGGLWIWCSECYTFFHGSIYVPEYWKNCPAVELEKLCAIPDYLNDIREAIDAHVENILISTNTPGGQRNVERKIAADCSRNGII